MIFKLNLRDRQNNLYEALVDLVIFSSNACMYVTVTKEVSLDEPNPAL